MSHFDQSAPLPIGRGGAERKFNPIMRFVQAVADARMRAYLMAVTDPATGRIDPDLERMVLRAMVF